MNEENESEDDDNYDKKEPRRNVNKSRGRKSSAKKGLFPYNNGDDDIEDSDTEDVFEL